MKKIFNTFVRYIIFSLLIVSIILDLYLPLKNADKMDVAEIIVTLLPLIFTIITISLSLPSEKIYGVSFHTLRKIRKDNHYSFIEMIMITIVLFVLFTIFTTLNFFISICCLDLIAVFFSIFFVFQEIPIILKSDEKIIKIIKKTLIAETSNDYTLGNLSKGKELYSIIQFIVVSQGVKQSFKAFKTSDKRKNAMILDYLLALNNDFLFKCVDLKDYFLNSTLTTYKGVNVLNAIDISLDSFCDLLSFGSDFDVVSIYMDSDHFYQITSMLFSLHYLTETLNLTNKFNNKVLTTLRFLSHATINNVNVQKFKYHFLNAMITRTVSNGELWFLRLLRDSEFYSIYMFNANKPYALFLSIYFYYLLEVDKTVKQPLKDDLFAFFNEPSLGRYTDPTNWYGFFNFFIVNTNINDLFGMLPELYKIYDNENNTHPWFLPDYRHSWCSLDGEFNKELILNCLLTLIIYNYRSYQFYGPEIEKVINSLTGNDKNEFACLLNKDWFSDNNFVGQCKQQRFLEIFKIKFIKNDKNVSNDVIRFFNKNKNSIIKKSIIKNSEEKLINSKSCLDIKEELFSIFNKAKEGITIHNKDLEIDDNKESFYQIIFDRNFEDALKELVTDHFKLTFIKIIASNIQKFVPSSNNYNFNENIEKFDYRTENIYILSDYEIKKEIVDKIKKIKGVDINLESFYIWKDGAISFNAICNESKSAVRELNDSEINNIIETKYKVSDGLYKYNEGDNNRSAFLNREEIYNIIKANFLISFIFYNYEVKIDKDNIIRIDKNNNS